MICCDSCGCCVPVQSPSPPTPHTHDIRANTQNVKQVSKAALSLSNSINNRRKARGLQPRPVRAAVIGFPNVGKSALINRFLSRRVCESAPKPGVTKQLRWLRVGGDLDLLDAPGQLCFYSDADWEDLYLYCSIRFFARANEASRGWHYLLWATLRR